MFRVLHLPPPQLTRPRVASVVVLFRGRSRLFHTPAPPVATLEVSAPTTFL